MRKFFQILFVSAVLAGFTFYGLATSVSAKDIKVGAVINLTGPASTWGQFHKKGHEDYFRYVNEVKGGIGGNKIKFTVVDHGYKPPEAAKYVKKFCTLDKMDMIATWDAASGNMAKPIIQRYKVPCINYSTDQAILKAPVNYMYHPFGAYTMDSYAVLEYIRSIHKGNGRPKVGLLTYMNAYGKTIHAPSKEYAAKHNVEIVGIIAFPRKTINLDTELLRLKNMGAQYVFLQILPAHIIMVMQSADRIKFKAPFFGTWTATDPDFFKRGKGLIRDRMTMQFTGALPVDKTPGIELLETLWKRYKTVTSFDNSYWEGVVVAMIMEKAFQRAHERFGKIDGERINRALETFRNENFGWLVPDVTYTNTDHSASWRARIVKVNEDQTYTPLTGFWAPGKEKIPILK
ncbi:MAG: ABC transporter substrate-binding protein [Deltaproteobacteria bacterium]|nr:ABC transporter substrate-binding protein [Deltaproteobacteria bacterium]